MNFRTKLVLAAIFAITLLIPTQKGFCSYFLSQGTETTELTRLDGNDGISVPNKGVYGYYDVKGNLVIVLDFSRSEQPLVLGIAYWQDNQQQNYGM